MSLIVRLLINAGALVAADWLLDGIRGPSVNNPDGILQVLIIALIFGLVNAVIRPIISVLSCPLQILTLGLFTFVINAAMLWLTGWISRAVGIPFVVDGPIAALLGSIIVSIVSIILSILIPDSWEGRERR